MTSYDAGAGTRQVTYPAAGMPGTQGNPIELAGEKITLNFWRPQRRAIAGAESGDYVDMGNLHYGIPIEAGGRQVPCDGHYSNLSPTLHQVTAGEDDYAERLFPLTDSAADAAPNASNLLAFSLDLGACMRANGIEPAGQNLVLGLTAGAESRPGGNDRALQEFRVCLPGCQPEQGGPGAPVGSDQPDGDGQPGSAPPPDLMLTSLTAHPDGADCRVDFTVRNAGGATPLASEVAIAGTRGGQRYTAAPAPIGGLQGGQEMAQTAVLQGTACAGMMGEARADHANQVIETDEANNLRSQAF